MTLNEAQWIVHYVVTSFDPDDVGRILIDRCAVDREFCHILARHGDQIFAAVIESLTATVH